MGVSLVDGIPLPIHPTSTPDLPWDRGPFSHPEEGPAGSTRVDV